MDRFAIAREDELQLLHECNLTMRGQKLPRCEAKNKNSPMRI